MPKKVVVDEEFLKKKRKVVELARKYPDKFFKWITGWEPRPFQKKFMKTDKRRVIMVTSRQSGKCLWRNQEIVNAETGEVKTVEEWYNEGERLKVVALDLDDYKLKIAEAKVFPNGKKPVYRVVTRRGHEIYVTDNHPFLTPQGWKELRELGEGDWIASVRQLPIDGGEEVDERLPIFLGLLVADGHVGYDSIQYSTVDEEMLKLMEYAVSYFDNVCIKFTGNKYNYRISKCSGRYGGRNLAMKWLKDFGYKIGANAGEKELPKGVFMWNNDAIAKLLGAMFACDGYVTKKGHIEFNTKSWKLAQQIKHLLLRLGIHSRIRVRRAKWNGNDYGEFYVVVIGDVENILNFINVVPLYNNRKKERLLGLVEELHKRMYNNNTDVVPFNMKNYEFNKKIAAKYNIGYEYLPQSWKVRKYAEEVGDEFLMKMVSEDIHWDRIERIEYIGEDETFDLEVDEYHNFVAGELIVHNSLVTSVKAIWKAWLFDNQYILVLSPTLRQSQELFKKVKHFVKEKNLIYQDVVRMTQTEIEFVNGSIIKVIPGTETSVRGFTADMVIIDEAAYVSDDVFGAVEPVIAVRRGQMILISTPGAPRGYFYDVWTNGDVKHWEKIKASVEEAHYDPDFIENYRKTHSEVEFKREILGLFVDDSSSTLFASELVKSRMTLPKGGFNGPVDGYVYYLGVDVARTGSDYTAVAVIGVPMDYLDNPVLVDEFEAEVHYLYYRQGATINRTIGMLRDEVIPKWNPIKIGIDSLGVGGGVVDVLREYVGSDRVVEIKAMGNERIDMYMTLKRMLEEERIALPNDMTLLEHFSNYDVRYSTTGRIQVKKRPDGHDDLADAIVYGVWTAFNDVAVQDVKVDILTDVNIDNLFR